MTTTMLRTLGLVLLGVSTMLSAQTNPPPANPAAREADRAFVAALGDRDKSALAGMLDAEFTWTGTDGATLTSDAFLDALPRPAIKGDAGATVTDYNYGDVEMIQAHGDREHILRIWAKRPAGWRMLLYQEVRLLSSAPPVNPGTGGTCVNPCTELPYQPKSDSERGAVTGYMALQKATVERDVPTWGRYVAEEFAAANSNSNKVLTRAGRMADLGRNKMAGYTPMPIVEMQVYDFGRAAVLVTKHQPVRGKPVHITRMWIERNGAWLEAASYQTRMETAPAVP